MSHSLCLIMIDEAETTDSIANLGLKQDC